MKRTLICLLVAACSPAADSRPNDSAPAERAIQRPDSTGWRYASLGGAALSLRYPLAQVRELRDEWKADCGRPAAPLFRGDDTAYVDRLYALRAPASFDDAVAIAGFTRHVDGADTTYALDSLEQSTFSEIVDTLTVGNWRALSALIEVRTYIDGDSVKYDPPKDNHNATMPPPTLYARRIVAVGPVTGQCRTLLAIQTHTVLRLGTAPMDTAMVRSLLETIRLR